MIILSTTRLRTPAQVIGHSVLAGAGLTLGRCNDWQPHTGSSTVDLAARGFGNHRRNSSDQRRRHPGVSTG